MGTTMVAVKIEKGIPMPIDGHRGGRSPFTLAAEAAMAQMEIGDSFSYEDNSKSGKGVTLREAAKRKKIKITSRKIAEGQYRVWRIE